MSPQSRAAAIAREVRNLLLPVVRSLPYRLADRRREAAQPRRRPVRENLFLESAMAAAKSMRAPIVTG